MFQKYVSNEQLNFQVNRFMEPYYSDLQVQQTLREAAAKIHDTDSWLSTWVALARLAESSGRHDLAAAYYQLAHFYLRDRDPRKQVIGNQLKENFYKTVDRSKLEFDRVPYEGKILPAVQIRQTGATQTLLLHGGFDSLLEELIGLCQNLLSLKNYNFIMFEGPGQGQAAADGLALTPEWEKPVRAVLDYYQLDNADLLGMSLGGYLSMRAAAFEPRVRKVIAFDMMYCAIDSIMMKLNDRMKALIEKIDKPDVAAEIDKIFTEKARTDIDLAFKLYKTYDITHVATPSMMVKTIKQYTLNGIEERITQDVLLLAGTRDQYVPIERFDDLKQRLVNANSVTGIVFDESTGGEQHCQVGHKQVAYDAMIEFLR